MQEAIYKLILIGIAAVVIYYIPMDAVIKRWCFIIIGIVVLLLLVAAIFGVHVLPGI